MRHRKATSDLTRDHVIAVVTDEAMNVAQDPATGIGGTGADVFAVKVAQSGGLGRGSGVVAMGQAAGLRPHDGTMLETGLRIAAGLQLLATVKRMDEGTELNSLLLLTQDILAAPVTGRDFCGEVPSGPGIGAALVPDKIALRRHDRGRTPGGSLEPATAPQRRTGPRTARPTSTGARRSRSLKPAARVR